MTSYIFFHEPTKLVLPKLRGYIEKKKIRKEPIFYSNES